MLILTYESVDGIPFGTAREKIEASLGPALRQRRMGGESIKLFYRDKIVDVDDEGLREVTVWPECDVNLNDVQVEWTSEFLRWLCRHDGEAVVVHDVIVLPKLGLSLTGVEEDERDERAMTAFRRGTWDRHRSEMRPLALS